LISGNFSAVFSGIFGTTAENSAIFSTTAKNSAIFCGIFSATAKNSGIFSGNFSILFIFIFEFLHPAYFSTFSTFSTLHKDLRGLASPDPV